MIQNAGLEVVRLNVPGKVTYDGESMSADYVNWLADNGVVVRCCFDVPAFSKKRAGQTAQVNRSFALWACSGASRSLVVVLDREVRTMVWYLLLMYIILGWYCGADISFLP